MRRALDAGPVVNGAPVANGIDTLTTIANYYAYATTLFRRHRINRGIWPAIESCGPANGTPDMSGPGINIVFSRSSVRRQRTTAGASRSASTLMHKSRTMVQTWRRIMKALIAALALVTLIASPTFARPAARASTQAEFVFPTDQQLCQSGRTDFCHWRGYPLWQWYSGT